MAIKVLVIGLELISGCNGKVVQVQSQSDRNRELLKSGCKGNSGLNDRDLELKSLF